MVRYYGGYSSRTRGSERERPEIEEPDPESTSQARQAAKAAWAKLIRKVYEVDPLICPQCGAQMRVIALIEDRAVIERILSWLGLCEPPQASAARGAREPAAHLPSRARHRLSAPQAALAVLAVPELAERVKRRAVFAITRLVCRARSRGQDRS